MIYLSGVWVPGMHLHRPDLGMLITPWMWNTLPLGELPWGVDTGCFTDPARFVLRDYLKYLAARRDVVDTCLFATAPDLLGDARGTWGISEPVLPLLRALGYAAALVAQDGFDPGAVDWEAFDVLFLGGTTAWKLSEDTYRLVQTASARGKWVHCGRVNSFRRLRAMAFAGVSSADGTQIRYRPTRYLPEVLGWLAALERQPPLVNTLARL